MTQEHLLERSHHLLPEDPKTALRARRFYPYLFESLGRDVALTVLDLQPGERALHADADRGELLLKMAALVGPEGRVVGAERSSNARAVAQARMREAGMTQATLVDAPLTALCAPAGPFENGSFDAAMVGYALGQLDDDTVRAVLEQLRRVLAPSGRLAVAGLTHGERRIGKAIALVYASVPAPLRERMGLPRPRRLQALAVDAGFDVDRRLYFEQRGVPSEVLLLRKRATLNVTR